MQLRLNGEPQTVKDGWSVADLLRHLGLAERRLAVEINREILARARYESHKLAAGDEVEIVHFVGGG